MVSTTILKDLAKKYCLSDREHTLLLEAAVNYLEGFISNLKELDPNISRLKEVHHRVTINEMSEATNLAFLEYLKTQV